jgi:transposase
MIAAMTAPLPLPESIWSRIPEDARAALAVLLEAQRERIEQLEALVAGLQARLSQDSSNSHKPPSANPPSAPAPAKKKPTGRKPGGQPGHPGHRRQRLPASSVSQVVPFVPKACSCCGLPLHAEAQPGDPQPTWHQAVELPERPVVVTEFQGHGRRCPCGTVTWEPIPDAIRAESIGPRLAAALNLLASWQHVSLRGLEDVCLAISGCEVSLGTLSRLREQMSLALAAPCETLAQEVADAPVKHIDETGWKNAGQREWVWAAVTIHAAFFLIRPGRGRDSLRALLGGPPRGIVVSDRWSAYSGIPLERRQLCWAHLKRDFKGMAEATGKARRAGENLLMLTEQMFWLLRRVRDGTRKRAWFRRMVERTIRPDVKLWLEEGKSSGHAPTAGKCAEILKLEEALWTFARVEGVEPTNNEAERALRPVVLKRKKSFGSHSAWGGTWLGRMMSICVTLRKRGLAVFDYLAGALKAFRAGQPIAVIPTPL